MPKTKASLQSVFFLYSFNLSLYFFLSENENILFFVSNRPGGQGGRDIWYSIRTNVGWSLAKNLSGGVNTEFDDIAPFISENLLDFYFSSNTK